MMLDRPRDDLDLNSLGMQSLQMQACILKLELTSHHI